jgi:hypothetical protein
MINNMINKKYRIYFLSIVFALSFCNNIFSIVLAPNEVRFSLGSGWYQSTETLYETPPVTGDGKVYTHPSGNELIFYGNEVLRTINDKGFGTDGDFYLSRDWQGNPPTELDEEHLYASPNLVVDGDLYPALLIVDGSGTPGLGSSDSPYNGDFYVSKKINCGGSGSTINAAYILPGSLWGGFVHRNLESSLSQPVIDPAFYAIKQNLGGTKTHINVIDDGSTWTGNNNTIDFIVAGDTTDPAIRIHRNGEVYIGMPAQSSSESSRLKLKVNGNIEMSDSGIVYVRKEAGSDSVPASGMYGINYSSSKFNLFSPRYIAFAKKTSTDAENNSFNDPALIIDNDGEKNIFTSITGIVSRDINTATLPSFSANLEGDVRLFTEGHIILGSHMEGYNAANGQNAYGTKLWFRGAGPGLYKNSPVWIARYNKVAASPTHRGTTELRVCVGQSTSSQLSIGYDSNVGSTAGFVTTHRLTASGHCYRGSDRRLKTDIEAISDPIQKIMKIQPVRYYLKSRPHVGLKTIGIIAQELEKILPGLVYTNDIGYKSINYIGLIPVLIEALKEQDKKINEYNKELDDLLVQLQKYGVAEDK